MFVCESVYRVIRETRYWTAVQITGDPMEMRISKEREIGRVLLKGKNKNKRVFMQI